MTRNSQGRQRARRGAPSIVQRKDQRWSLTVELPRGPDGKRRRMQSTYSTYDEALAASRRVDYSAAPLSAAERNLTVEALLERWLARQPPAEYSSQENRSWLSATLKAQLGNKKVTQLSRRDVEAMQHGLLEQRRAPSSINKAVQRLRSALDLAVEADLIRTNPARGVRAVRSETRRRMQAWSPEEVRAILLASQESPLGVLILVAIATGARLGELLGARKQDYDPQTGVLRITGTLKKGGGRGKPKTATALRDLPLPPEVQEQMAQHLREVAERQRLAGPVWGRKREVSEETRKKQREAAHAQSGGRLPERWRPTPPPATSFEPLFPTSHGTPWSARNAQRVWKRVLEAAGVPHRNFHSVRGHFATQALQAGSPLKNVQDVLGHASPLMSLHYQRSVEGSERQVISAVVQRLGLHAGTPTPVAHEPLE